MPCQFCQICSCPRMLRQTPELPHQSTKCSRWPDRSHWILTDLKEVYTYEEMAFTKSASFSLGLVKGASIYDRGGEGGQKIPKTVHRIWTRGGGQKIRRTLRGLPYMTSTKFSDCLPPPPPPLSLSQISWFCSFCLLSGDSPRPPPITLDVIYGSPLKSNIVRAPLTDWQSVWSIWRGGGGGAGALPEQDASRWSAGGPGAAV